MLDSSRDRYWSRGLSMAPGLISKKAERCLNLLQAIAQGRHLATDILEWAENALIKLNLFVAKLGVLAAGSLSIDHRLRRNKTVSNAVTQILEAAVLDLVDCATIIAHRGGEDG